MDAIATMTQSCTRSRELCVTDGLSEHTYDRWAKGRDEGAVVPARGAGGGE